MLIALGVAHQHNINTGIKNKAGERTKVVSPC